MQRLFAVILALLLALPFGSASAAVSSTASSVQYSGNGSVAIFSFPYPYFQSADLLVQLFNSSGVAVSPAPVLNGSGTFDYTVTGLSAFSASGNNVVEFASANITFNTAPPGGDLVVITRALGATQGLNLLDNAKFPASSVNAALDRQTMVAQQLVAAVAASVQAPTSDPSGLSYLLPPVATRASQIFCFDASGNVSACAPAAGSTTISAAMTPVVQAATLASARNQLNIPFSLFKGPVSTPYSVAAPGDIGTLISSESAGGALTVNLPSAATAGAGASYGFVRKTNNLTLNRAGSDVIQGIGATFTTLTLVTDGDGLALESDGTNWKTIGASPGAWALLGGYSPAATAGSFKALKIVGSGTGATITADELAVEDSNGNVVRLRTVSQAIAWATSGAGGLDTGSFAGGNWYYHWIVYNASTQTASAITSLSSTAPTLPAGFTFKARVGATRSVSTTKAWHTQQYGARAQIVVDGTDLTGLPSMANAGSATVGSTSVPTYVSIATGNFVPATAARIRGLLATTGNDSSIVSPNASYGAIGSLTNPPGLTANTGLSISAQFDYALESTNIFWANTHGTGNAAVLALGWEDNL